jgi:hypothetical protein
MRISLRVGIVSFCAMMFGCAPTESSEPARRADLPPGGKHGLTYTVERYLPGLDEHVVVTKSPTNVRVTRADGSPATWSGTLASEKAALRTRFGAALPRFSRSLDAARPDEIFPFLASYRLSVNLADLERRMRGPQRQLAIAELHAAISEAGESLEARLKALGAKVAARSSHGPFLVGTASVAALRTIARDPELTFLSSGDPGLPVLDATQALEVYATPDAFHAHGWNGAGQAVGVIEPGNGRVWDQHAIFGQGIEYTDDFTPCSTVDDCSSLMGTTGSFPRECKSFGQAGSFCVTRHGTAVAGIVAEHAPEARIIFPNTTGWTPYQEYPFPWAGCPDCEPYTEHETVGCSHSAMWQAYTALLQNGAKFVNESFHCREGYSFDGQVGWRDGREMDGLIQDYFARAYDFTVFKSAGNKASGPYEEACPYLNNAICVGATPSTRDRVSCFSNFANPVDGNAPIRISPARTIAARTSIGSAPTSWRSGARLPSTDATRGRSSFRSP